MATTTTITSLKSIQNPPSHPTELNAAVPTTRTRMTNLNNQNNNRPRRRSSSGSVSKHLNLWRDIDSDSAPSAANSSAPGFLTGLLLKYTPTPIKARLDRITPHTWDLLIATFFSALALIILSIVFVGPHWGFITATLGTYTAVFGIWIGVGEVWGYLFNSTSANKNTDDDEGKNMKKTTESEKKGVGNSVS